MTEALRLFLVVQALGFADVSLGPVGRGLRRAHRLAADGRAAQPGRPRASSRPGVVGVLHVGYGVPLPEATAIALLDRVISVFSIIVFGSIAYALSPKPRGLGRIPAAGRRPHGGIDAGLIAVRRLPRRGSRAAGRSSVTHPQGRAPMPCCIQRRHAGRTFVRAVARPGHCDAPS